MFRLVGFSSLDGALMMYPYVVLADEAEITHSHINE